MKIMNFSDKFSHTKAVLNGEKTMMRFPLGKDVPLGNWMDTEKHLPFQQGDVVAIAQSYHSIYLSKLSKINNINNKISSNGNTEKDALLDFKKQYESFKGWHDKKYVHPSLMVNHIIITDVRIERVQDISDEECIAEGVFCGLNIPHECLWFTTPKEVFIKLFDEINGHGAWDDNPYVVVYNFKLNNKENGIDI